jgi:NitT/TauT family transport system substrate-binding protein
MNMRFLATIGQCTLLASALLASVPTARADERVEVLISSYGFQVFPVLVAKELGYFHEEGIDMNVTRVEGGGKAMAAVMGGDAQIILAVPSSVFQARSRGADVVSFGAVFSQIGSNFVMSKEWAAKHNVTEKTPYPEKLRALKGAVVGVNTAGSGTDQVVRYLAKEAKIDPDRDMTISAVGTGDVMTAALSRGVIQGFLQGSPVGENAIQNHGAMMFVNTVEGEVPALNGFLYMASVAKESWLKSHADLAVRYTRAMQKALNTIRDPAQTDKARDVIHKVYHPKIDKALFDATWAEHVAAFSKSSVITDAMIQQIASFTNEFEAPIPAATVKASWTDEYAKKAEAK